MQACLRHVRAHRAGDLAGDRAWQQQALCRYHSRDDVLRAYRRQKSVLGKLRQRIAVPLFIAIAAELGARAPQIRSGGGRIRAVCRFRFTTIIRPTRRRPITACGPSPAEKYLVLTCDGDGDGLCATVRIMGGGEDRLVAATPWDNSLGALYSWITSEWVSFRWSMNTS